MIRTFFIPPESCSSRILKNEDENPSRANCRFVHEAVFQTLRRATSYSKQLAVHYLISCAQMVNDHIFTNCIDGQSPLSSAILYIYGLCSALYHAGEGLENCRSMS